MPYDISYYYDQIGCLYKGRGENTFILIKDVIDKKQHNGYHFVYEVYNPTDSGIFQMMQECNLFLDNCKKIS